MPEIINMKKVELHRHFEGCIDLEFVKELMTKYPDSKATADLEPIEDLYNYTTFEGFLSVFGKVILLLKNIEDFRNLSKHVISQLEHENVIYAELIFSPQTYIKNGMELQKVLHTMYEIFNASKIRTHLIIDLVRQWSLESANHCLDIIMEIRHNDSDLKNWIKAISIGGDELNYPPALFSEVFKRAKEAGLKTYAHAGEWGNSQYIWDVIHLLGVKRIGHGIRAIDDPKLVRFLVKNKIGLDISITSNYFTGALEKEEEHPILQLMDKGVSVSVNSDDPGFFKTDMNQEYQRLYEMGVTLNDLRKISEKVIYNSFLETEHIDTILTSLRGPSDIKI